MKFIRFDDASTVLPDEIWEQIVALDFLLGNQAWDQKSWQHYLAQSTYWKLATLMVDRQVNGFSLFLTDQFGEQAHLLKIIIDPGYRRQGGAKEILDVYLKNYPDTESIFLEVRTDNLEAISFYEGYGFQVLHEVKAYYQDGCSARKMIYYRKMM